MPKKLRGFQQKGVNKLRSEMVGGGDNALARGSKQVGAVNSTKQVRAVNKSSVNKFILYTIEPPGNHIRSSLKWGG